MEEDKQIRVYHVRTDKNLNDICWVIRGMSATIERPNTK